MTPKPACFDKKQLLLELQEATATVILLYNREIEVVTSGTATELAVLNSDIQKAKARREALESAYKRHVSEHGC